MSDFLKKIKVEFMMSSIMCIVLGIVLVIWGDHTLLMIGRVIGIIIAVTGAAGLIGFFMEHMEHKVSAVADVIILLIGIWIWINPKSVAGIVPIAIGVILIFHGIKAVSVALEAKGYGDGTWGVGVVLAVLSLVFGVMCILNAFKIMSLVTTAIGIALIYNGVSNIFIAARSTRAARNYHFTQDAVDVEFKD